MFIHPRTLTVALLALTLAGCQTTTVSSLPTTPTSASDLPTPLPTPEPDNGDRRVSADEAVGGDPSAGRLHDIEGALLSYIAVYKRMPVKLEELTKFADDDAGLQLTAPSGRPYLYVPNGLVAPGRTQRIIVADPAPSPAGIRWCILMPPGPPRPGQMVYIEVQRFPEQAFKLYVPAE